MMGFFTMYLLSNMAMLCYFLGIHVRFREGFCVDFPLWIAGSCNSLIATPCCARDTTQRRCVLRTAARHIQPIIALKEDKGKECWQCNNLKKKIVQYFGTSFIIFHWKHVEKIKYPAFPVEDVIEWCELWHFFDYMLSLFIHRCVYIHTYIHTAQVQMWATEISEPLFDQIKCVR